MKPITFIITLLLFQCSLFSQVAPPVADTLGSDRSFNMVTDTVPPSDARRITLSALEAAEFLKRLYNEGNWRSEDEPLRNYIGDLIAHAEAEHQNRVIGFLEGFPFEVVRIAPELYVRTDTVRIPLSPLRDRDITEINEYIVFEGDTVFLPDPSVIYDLRRYLDSLLSPPDTIPEIESDTLIDRVADTIVVDDTLYIHTTDTADRGIDTLAIVPVGVSARIDSAILVRDVRAVDIVDMLDDSLIVAAGLDRDLLEDVPLYDVVTDHSDTLEQPSPVKLGKNLYLDRDTLLLIFHDTLRQAVSPDPAFPFAYYDYPFTGDTIESAVNELVALLERRDSTLIEFTSVDGNIVPVWINSQNQRVRRFWLRNEFEDSVTVWIGNPYRNAVGLYLENGIQFRRPIRATTPADPSIRPVPTERMTLGQVSTLDVKHNLWRYHSDVSLMLNQVFLSNWARGGESSLSGSLDIQGNANYVDDDRDFEFINSARIRHGFVYGEETGLRRNMDRLDINSRLNSEAFGEFDFSSTAHFQTQLAKGYRYPNDSVAISRFLNPGRMTIGTGLDYRPNRETSVNLSPLSYRVTFMTDTANFNQRRQGIEEDRKSRHQLGANLRASYRFDLFDNIRITNRLELYSNYLDKPKNIDIDWELILTTSLNWFTDVRININLIYDDDVKFPVEDSEGNPVLDDEGNEREVPRIQLREVMGFTLVFRF